MRALADLVAAWRAPKPLEPEIEAERESCVLCGAATADMESYATLGVCTVCGYHHAISAWKRIKTLTDVGTFREIHASTTSIDPLSFPEGGDYRDRLREAFRRTRLREALITGVCEIRSRPAVIIIMEFGFLGGSMGVVVGERVTLAFEYAARHQLPVVSVITSSGTRVREGVLALMQMGKTAAAAEQHSRRGLAHFTILANPSTGGVFASFANLADVIVGEPAALMGFVTLRDLEQTEGGTLPPDTHTAESHLQHGLIDQVVTRERQPDLLASLIDLTTPAQRLQINKGLQPFTWRPSRTISPWQEVQLARHERRPSALDYIGRIATTFVDLHGDRAQGDAPGIVTGFADIHGEPVMLIGQQRVTEGEQGPPWIDPAGFRKALRAMRLAQKFKIPVVTLIDNRGARPSREAEEHGIGHAIAENLAAMMRLRTPVVAVIIGEGGGEGALAFAVADRILMLEHAIFSVASPERAAAMLYRDPTRADLLAEALRLTAADALDLGVMDRIVREPEGGAHRDHDAAAAFLQAAIRQELDDLHGTPTSKLLRDRYRKYRDMGIYQNFFRVSLSRNIRDFRRSVRRRMREKVLRLFRSSPAPEPDDDAHSIPVD